MWSDETKINLFCSDGVQNVWQCPVRSTKKIVPCLLSSIMVWDCMSAAGTGELHFIVENMDSNTYCVTFKQNMTPSLQKLGQSA